MNDNHEIDGNVTEKEKFDVMLYEKLFRDGRCRFESDGKTVDMQETDDTYTVRKEPEFPDMVCEFEAYFADTLTLMQKGHMLKLGGARIGVWQSFDKDGLLTEETNYEEGWSIHWEQILGLAKREGIDWQTVVSIDRIEQQPVDSETGAEPICHDTNKYWRIGLMATSDVVANYTFDGQTGKRLPVTFTILE